MIGVGNGLGMAFQGLTFDPGVVQIRHLRGRGIDKVPQAERKDVQKH
jgi:hypothetical protein